MRFSRAAISFLLTITLSFSTRAFAQTEKLTYTLTPRPADSILHVDMTWTTGDRDSSSLEFLSHWASVENIVGMMRDLKCVPDAKRSSDGLTLEFKHAPRATISASYDVMPSIKRLDWSQSHHPIVTAEFFHGAGHTFLLAPQSGDNDARQFDVEIIWKLPDDWPTAVSSLGLGTKAAARVRIMDLRNAVYFAGRLETREVVVMGQLVTIALRDQFAFTPEEFLKTIVAIITAERRFMSDVPFPPFLVTAVEVGDPLRPGETSFGGTGYYNSFATYLPPKSTINNELKHLLAHELFHYWNGRILDREQPEERVYWFSEGVTDYYAARLLLESGEWDKPTYAKRINDRIAAYQRNPAKLAKNDVIEREFWSARDSVGELPYQRGLLLALRWHAIAKKHGVTDGFDRLFHELVLRGLRNGYRLSNDTIRAAGVELLGEWFGPEFDRYVINAELVDLPEDTLAPEFASKREVIYEFVLGFEKDRSLKDGRVRGLLSDSAAEKAGLREGDTLTGWSFYSDPNREVELTVKRDSGEQVIKFLPRGAAIEVTQFEPR